MFLRLNFAPRDHEVFTETARSWVRVPQGAYFCALPSHPIAVGLVDFLGMAPRPGPHSKARMQNEVYLLTECLALDCVTVLRNGRNMVVLIAAIYSTVLRRHRQVIRFVRIACSSRFKTALRRLHHHPYQPTRRDGSLMPVPIATRLTI